MKNFSYWIRIFVILVLAIVAMSLNGCKTTQPIVEQQKEVQTPKELQPVVWKQSLYEKISLKDSVLFYNSAEIRLEGSFFNQTFFIEDGVINTIDSINNVLKVVSEMTPGGFIDMKKDKYGNIDIMSLSFSKEEATYKFNFFRLDDGSFGLSGKAELIFRGQKYPIVASTLGDCRLLVYFKKSEVINNEEDAAEGWQQQQQQRQTEGRQQMQSPRLIQPQKK